MKTCVVKKSFTFKSLLPSLISVIIGIVFALLAAHFIPVLFVPLLAAGVIIGAVIAPGNLFTEYEYTIEGDSFSVSVIRNNASRKELFSCDISFLLSCEPYTGGKTYGTRLDYSENINTTYCATFNEEGKQAAVIFSPDEAFIRELFLLAPSKVKRNII